MKNGTEFFTDTASCLESMQSQ